MRSEDTLRLLREGNRRFAAGETFDRDVVGERVAAAPIQRPAAVIIACSDARVPVEMVFDQGIGDLFVVRAAGHVLEPAGWASVWFAVAGLGVRTIVVLGHEACGAVRAALSDTSPEELSPVTAPIRRSIAGCAAKIQDEDEAVRLNVAATVKAASEMLSGAGDVQEAISVEGAVYRMSTGQVEWLRDPEGDV